MTTSIPSSGQERHTRFEHPNTMTVSIIVHTNTQETMVGEKTMQAMKCIWKWITVILGSIKCCTIAAVETIINAEDTCEICTTQAEEDCYACTRTYCITCSLQQLHEGKCVECSSKKPQICSDCGKQCHPDNMRGQSCGHKYCPLCSVKITECPACSSIMLV